MKCPHCEEDKLIEVESWEPDWMDYGWSIKECSGCGFKVKDVTMDGRFARVDYVIRKPQANANTIKEQ